MDVRIPIIAAITASLAELAKDPALGYRGQAILSSLTLLSTLMGQEGTSGLTQLRTDLERMLAEGREPTKDEWYGLRDRSRKAHELIQGVSDA